MPTVNELIAQAVFPPGLEERRHLVNIYGSARSGTRNGPAQSDDGFGWSALHIGPRGHVSSGGVWRSKGGSWAAKKIVPFASTVVVWNVDRMLVTMKRYWYYYTPEEKEDIQKAMEGFGIRFKSTDEVRRESPFAKWSEQVEGLVSEAA